MAEQTAMWGPAETPAQTPLPTAAHTPTETGEPGDSYARLCNRIEELRRQRIDNAAIEVHRWDSGRKVYIQRYDLVGFSLEAIQHDLGAGRYFAGIKVGSRYDLGASFDVSEPAVRRRPETQVGAIAAAPAAPAADITALLMGQLNMLQGLVVQLVQSKGETPQLLDREMMFKLLEDRSGPGQLIKAMQFLRQLESKEEPQQESAGNGAGGMAFFEKIVDRVLSSRARPAAPQTSPAGVTGVSSTKIVPQPAPAPGPAAATASSAELGASAEAVDMEKQTGIPITGYARQLMHAVSSDLDAETTGIVLYRMTEKRVPLATLTPTVRLMLEDLNGEDAAGNLCEWFPQLQQHRAFCVSALDTLAALIAGNLAELDAAKAKAEGATATEAKP